MIGFIDFSLKTEFSIGHALGNIDKFIDVAKSNGLSHLSVSDYASVGVWVKHYFNCKKSNIIPILGMTVFVSDHETFSQDGEIFYKNLKTGEISLLKDVNEYSRDMSTIHYEVCLFAKNITGYYNLIKLHNLIQLNGGSFPVISTESLLLHGDGLVCVLPIEFSEIGDKIYNNEDPLPFYRTYSGVFDEVLLSATISSNIDVELFKRSLELCKGHQVKIIPVGNCRYPEKEDKEAFKMIRKVNRIRNGISFDFDDDEKMHLKTIDELKEEFLSNSSKDQELFNESVFKSLFDNLQELLNEFKVIELDTSPKMPKFPDAERILKEKAWLGLEKRGLNGKKEYEDRLSYELDNVLRAGFADYFLFLEDVVSWYIDEKKCLMSSGRGSGGGSLVLYCLRIMNIDPVKHKLLFERFLDAARLDEIISKGLKPTANDLPDADLDFSAAMKDEVKEYLVNKYGKEHVCSIGTVGYMKVKGLLKNMARVLDVPDSEINELTTIGLKDLTKDDEDLSIEELCVKYPVLKAFLRRYPMFGDTFNRLYGSINSLGKHAAGMIVSDLDLTQHLPVRVDDGKLVSCWSEGIQGRELGMMGFVKMDFLNIETLDVIEEMMSLVKERTGKVYTFENIPLDNIHALSQLNCHNNLGVFQFDTHLANKVVDAMGGVHCFEDLASLSALMRPGALQNKFDVLFGELRKNPQDVYIPNCLKPYFEDTYGLPIFQEHAFFFAKYFVGLSNVESYNFMKTLYKAKMVGDKIDYWKKKVIDDAIAKGSYEISYKEYAETMFNQLLKFQNYSFNLSHAKAYSVYSAVQLWFKQNYPIEFWCASLNAVDRSKEKKGISLLDQRVRECISIGINVTPPNINKSGARWTIDGCSLIGSLVNIKGFGELDAEMIISNRPYSSVKDFLDKTKCSKTKFESLLFAGAFDDFGTRNELYNWYIKSYGEKKKQTNQLELFFDELEEEKDDEIVFADIELDNRFMDLNGYRLDKNLLVEYASLIKKEKIKTIGDALKRKGGSIRVIGKIVSMVKFTARSGVKWNKISLSDGVDNIEILGGERLVESYGDKVEIGKILLLNLSCTGKGFFLGDPTKFDVILVN